MFRHYFGKFELCYIMRNNFIVFLKNILAHALSHQLVKTDKIFSCKMAGKWLALHCVMRESDFACRNFIHPVFAILF